MLIAMDMSMRSSGLMALEADNTIIGFQIIETTKKDFPDHEDLINRITGDVVTFIEECDMISQETILNSFVIEGLAYAGLSAQKDVIAGIYWAVRVAVWNEYPDMPIGSVPVASWRAKVLNKEDRKYAKENYTPKAEALKKATVNKLPTDVYDRFHDYLGENKMSIKKMYDLADAYFMGVYRNSL